MCTKTYKLKITLATDSCSEGNFAERGVLPIPFYIFQFINFHPAFHSP